MKLRFLKNAAYLTLTGFLLRALGMLMRIYLSARIGEEGMGIYQLVTSAYFLFITLAQSGLAVTVTGICASKLAVCERAQAQAVLKSAVKTALFTGTLSGALMLMLSGVITKYWIADIRAFYALCSLSLSLPFIATCGVLSGYFTANKNVVNGCLAQIIEQLSRLAAVAAAIALFSESDISVLLAAVFFANTLSEAVSCGFLALCYLRGKRFPHPPKESYVKQIVTKAYPVALTRYLVSGLHTVENMLAPVAITLYTDSRALALSQFGALKGMALPLLFFPFSLLSALSTLLLPEISESGATGNRARTEAIVRRTCNITLTLSVMVGGVFFILSDDIGMTVYSSDKVGPILRVLAPIVPFMYLDSICDGLLKGLGMQKKVLFNNCIDSALRILLTLFLVPRTGLSGFLFMMIVSNVTVSLLNFRQLLLASGVKNRIFTWWILPFLYAFASAFITNFLPSFGATIPNLLLHCLFFCLIYGVFSLLFTGKNIFYKKTQKSPLI